MGLLDMLQGAMQQEQPEQQPGQQAAQQQIGGTNARVAGGLMQALDEHPGGLAGVLQNFQQNGMSEHVQNWSSGQQQTATPEQVQQGVGGTGLIENVAAKAGVSPETAKMAMAILLPVLMAHYTQGGQQPAPQSGFGGMAGQILGRFL